MNTHKKDKLSAKAESIALDIFKTCGKNEETAFLLAQNLYRFGESLVEKVEDQENLTLKIDCSKGCSYCCYAQVSVTPPEAILIGNHIKNNYSLSDTDKLVKRISNNIKLTKDKSLEERVKVWEKTPCIFLENEVCSIYEVRPFICRAWHSLNASQCKNAFMSGDHEAEIDSTPYRNYILGSVRDGLIEACRKTGCESEPMEITEIMKYILNHHSPEMSWVNGDKIFSK